MTKMNMKFTSSLNKAPKIHLIRFKRTPMSVLTKRRLTHWRTPSDIRWNLRDKPSLVPQKMRGGKKLKLPIDQSQLARVAMVIAATVQFFEQVLIPKKH